MQVKFNAKEMGVGGKGLQRNQYFKGLCVSLYPLRNGGLTARVTGDREALTH